MRFFFSFFFSISTFFFAGCYRSHVRGAPADAGVVAVDAPVVRDAARPDAPEIDAGPPRSCDTLAVTGTAELDEGVTPRLVALPGGDVGVVYVRTDGDPTRVLYERLDRTLTRVTGPISVATDSFTWAEIANVGPELIVAYGLAGEGTTVLAHLTFDGASTGEREVVALFHPSIFQPTGPFLLWASFDMSDDNSLVLTHVTQSGEIVHGAQIIALGRYGSGHHAALRSDGSHVLGYPREGPPGARHGYLSVIEMMGMLGPERQLDPVDADRSVTPVTIGDGLVVVRETEDALVIEPTDPTTLERIERVVFPPLESSPIASVLAGRLIVAHVVSGVFRWDFFASDLSGGDRYEVATPHPGTSGASSVAAFPDAVVFAVGLTDGPLARPWLVRVECAE